MIKQIIEVIRVNKTIKLNQKKSDHNVYSRKIGRMGNSLGVSFPKLLAEKLDISQGDEIEFVENDGEIILRKARQIELPKNIRLEVLEAFYDVFEEDRAIFDDLKDR
ncbi:AbrB/MazE/SpoVT family DNA-binding domain-containing protein [Paenibacillus nuruki]|uniref:AbrB/MazE/SpoVT family DNA-binding domain-containing protein n=1 Tax=Paenibacillus nuruki TaxID=1886670 RepID=UPI00084671E7|nr:AbrB/MazE/SpoVT family DNA-binding domain-containing protein [Paenibacillus nuruki]